MTVPIISTILIQLLDDKGFYNLVHVDVIEYHADSDTLSYDTGIDILTYCDITTLTC